MSFLTDVQTNNNPEVKQASASPVNGSIARILTRVTELAVLPHVVFRILEISGESDSPGTELERTITVDPGFSAKLLSLANSSYYALPRKITSVRDAVVYLGFKTVREMAMTVGVFDVFVGKNDKESLRRRGWWRHSIDTAVCCKYLAEKTGRLDPAEAYTCGLLHYIGKSLLDRFGESDYLAVEQRIAVGTDEIQAEQRVYGCDHMELGAAAAQKWGLPQNVVASFRYIGNGEPVDGFSSYRACNALADGIAKLAIEGSGNLDALHDWSFVQLGLTRESGKEVYEAALQQIAAASTVQF